MGRVLFGSQTRGHLVYHARPAPRIREAADGPFVEPEGTSGFPRARGSRTGLRDWRSDYAFT